MADPPEDVTESDVYVMGIRHEYFPLEGLLFENLMVQPVKKLHFIIFHIP